MGGGRLNQFTIKYRTSQRVAAFVTALLIALVFVGTVVLAVALSQTSDPVALVMAVFVWGVALGMVWIIAQFLVAAFGHKPLVTVDADGITIIDGLQMGRPLVFPPTDIKAVAVRIGDSDSWWNPKEFDIEREKRGVKWTAGDAEVSAALDDVTVFMLPMLNRGDRAVKANTVILLRQQVELSDYKKKFSLGWGPDRPSGPRWGVLLALEDPGGFATAVSEWELLTKLRAEDFPAVEPQKADIRRWRIQRVLRYAVIAYFLLRLVEVVVGRR